MGLGFKTERERTEYGDLPKNNSKLFALLIDLVSYVHDMFDKDVVLTAIYRTPEEEAALYQTTVDKIIHSPHFDWNAFDLRSSIYTADEIQGIENYVKSKYKNANGSVVVLYHTLPGNAFHFHFQLFPSA